MRGAGLVLVLCWMILMVMLVAYALGLSLTEIVEGAL